MKVSIIIPVYNAEAYIENCLLSAFNQTYRDIEIILVDDCGQDKSMEVAEKVIANHAWGRKVKIVRHSVNRGLSAARNTGIEAGSGEYVYFLDSDDDITPDCIERLTSLIDEQKPDFVIGNHRTINRRNSMLMQLKLANGVLSGNAEIFRSYLAWGWYQVAWNKLINRAFLLNNRLFFKEGLIHEDALWSFMLASCAETMGVVRDITYNYYYWDRSIMTIDYEKRLPHYLSVLQSMAEYVQARNLSLNGLIYQYGEIFKVFIFIYAIYAECSRVSLKEAYRVFRRCKIKEAVAFRIPFVEKLRDIHYIFPSSVGFFLYYGSLWTGIQCVEIFALLRKK